SGLARRLRATYPGERFTGVVLAEPFTGDMFQFVLAGDPPCFLTSRTTLYSASHFRDFLAMRSARYDWWERLDQARVNLVVLNSRTDRKLLAALEGDPAWELVAGTPGWKESPATAPLVLAVRKEPAP